MPEDEEQKETLPPQKQDRQPGRCCIRTVER